MFSKKFCIIISTFFLISSCSTQEKKETVKRVRFVDSKGNETFLRRRVPEFNKQQLSKQKMSDPNIKIMNGNVDYNQDSLPEELFSDKTSQNNQIQYNVKESSNNDELIFKPTEKEKKLKNDLIQKRKQNSISSSSTKQKNENKTIPPKKIESSNEFDEGVFFIQIGAYKLRENASEGLKKYSSIGKGVVKSYKNKKGKIIYRTLLGPYNSRSQAEKDLEKVIQKGHYDVYITRK